MPVNPGVAASNVPRASLVGQTDKLLSVDAITHPQDHLFGHAAGGDRDFLFSIFTPAEEMVEVFNHAMQQWAPEPAGYAYPGIYAIILSKPGGEELTNTHFGAPKIRIIVDRLGMQAGVLEGLMADIRHAK
jgi:hypothetical protein